MPSVRLACCSLFADLPKMKKIYYHTTYLMYLKVLHAMSCSQEFLDYFEPRAANKGWTVAIIYYTPNYIFDPFKEIHFINHYATVHNDKFQWIGQVDENGNPDGPGKLIIGDKVIETILKNGQKNGYTRESIKNRGEQEAGYYINGMRSGTFFDARFGTYEVFYKNNPLIRTFGRGHRGDQWVASYSDYADLSKRTTDSLPLLYDCAATIELNGTIRMDYGLFMLGNVIHHLILSNCDSRKLTMIVISQCPNLLSIDVVNNVYTMQRPWGMFWVDRCPQLEKISIHQSSLVYFSNLLLTGERTVNRLRIDLPSLRTLTIGSGFLSGRLTQSCFLNCKHLYLINLRNLTQLTLGVHTFKNLKSLVLGKRKGLIPSKIALI